jgi:hypothetical protein
MRPDPGGLLADLAFGHFQLEVRLQAATEAWLVALN